MGSEGGRKDGEDELVVHEHGGGVNGTDGVGRERAVGVLEWARRTDRPTGLRVLYPHRGVLGSALTLIFWGTNEVKRRHKQRHHGKVRSSKQDAPRSVCHHHPRPRPPASRLPHRGARRERGGRVYWSENAAMPGSLASTRLRCPNCQSAAMGAKWFDGRKWERQVSCAREFSREQGADVVPHRTVDGTVVPV